jgi:hypothetical protein
MVSLNQINSSYVISMDETTRWGRTFSQLLCVHTEITVNFPESCHLIGSILLIENSQIIDIYLIICLLVKTRKRGKENAKIYH